MRSCRSLGSVLLSTTQLQISWVQNPPASVQTPQLELQQTWPEGHEVRPQL